MPEADTREPHLRTWLLPRERASAKLRAGRPLLHDEPVVLDLDLAIDCFVQLAAERGLDVRRLDLMTLLTEAFVQHIDHVQQLAAAPDLDSEAIATLAEHAVRPLRRAYADRLRTFVREWSHGYCPICGWSPGRAGVVECSACGFSWQAARVEPSFRIELALTDDEDA